MPFVNEAFEITLFTFWRNVIRAWKVRHKSVAGRSEHSLKLVFAEKPGWITRRIYRAGHMLHRQAFTVALQKCRAVNDDVRDTVGGRTPVSGRIPAVDEDRDILIRLDGAELRQRDQGVHRLVRAVELAVDGPHLQPASGGLHRSEERLSRRDRGKNIGYAGRDAGLYHSAGA